MVMKKTLLCLLGNLFGFFSAGRPLVLSLLQRVALFVWHLASLHGHEGGWPPLQCPPWGKVLCSNLAGCAWWAFSLGQVVFPGPFTLSCVGYSDLRLKGPRPLLAHPPAHPAALASTPRLPSAPSRRSPCGGGSRLWRDSVAGEGRGAGILSCPVLSTPIPPFPVPILSLLAVAGSCLP